MILDGSSTFCTGRTGESNGVGVAITTPVSFKSLMVALISILPPGVQHYLPKRGSSSGFCLASPLQQSPFQHQETTLETMPVPEMAYSNLQLWEYYRTGLGTLCQTWRKNKSFSQTLSFCPFPEHEVKHRPDMFHIKKH